MSRWRPKQWPRPRSRRSREEQSPDFSLVDILKDKYSDGRRRPAWTELSLKFGWMTLGDYYAVEPELEGRNVLREILYQESPLFRMLKKSASFSGT